MEPDADPSRSDDAADVAAVQADDTLGQRIRGLYQHAGLSTRRIAAALGIGRRRVDSALRDGGVEVAPRGAGRPRPSARYPDPDDLAQQLRALYLDERLTRHQISEKLGLTEGLVRIRLAELGIPTRTRGWATREDRRDVPTAELIAHYRDRGLTAEATARQLGTSRGIVIRAAHDRGLPVRRGAAMGEAADPIELIDALYADPLIRRVLTRHHVPEAPAGGPLWQRFPRPVPLTRELCLELYLDCGVSITHIELLTGQPASTIRRMLHQAGAAMRQPGGRCPFLLRLERGRGCPSTTRRLV